MQLSIIIPAYNESRKIAGDIAAAAKFLKRQQITGEIIVSDDGSTDDTAQTARSCPAASDIGMKVIENPHRGKGNAVKQGILQSAGEIVMFADSGLCVPFSDAIKGIDMLRSQECDIAHGSRKTAGSDIKSSQPLMRRFYSRVFHTAAVALLKIPADLTDTQCGFKIYKGDLARSLYRDCQTEGFLFDVEIIILARRLGARIKEFPVTWTCDPDSRLSPSKNGYGIVSELLRIRKSFIRQK